MGRKRQSNTQSSTSSTTKSLSTKEDIKWLQKDFEQAKQELANVKDNTIKGIDLDQYIFNLCATRLDPIYYIENVLRAHLPESRKHLHSNQIELVRAACNPKIRRVAGIMARQCFAKDTPILMANGTIKLVQDIEIGDAVLTPDNVASHVLFTTSDTDLMYKIVPRDNPQQAYVVNGAHKLALTDSIRRIVLTVEEFIDKYGYSSTLSPYSGYRAIVSHYPDYISLRPSLYKFDATNLESDKLPLDIVRGSITLRTQYFTYLQEISTYRDGYYHLTTTSNEYKDRLLQLLHSLNYPVSCYAVNNTFYIRFTTIAHTRYDFSIIPLSRDTYYGFTIDSDEHLFLLGTGIVASNSGKCFAPGTLIMMADGRSKKVEDIQVNDYVMSPLSKPVQVVALGHGHEKMYQVKSLDLANDTYTVNQSHILSCISKSVPDRIINISVSNYLKLSKQQQQDLLGYRASLEFARIPIQIDPYILGLWISLGKVQNHSLPILDSNIYNYLRTYCDDSYISIKSISLTDHLYTFTSQYNEGNTIINTLFSYIPCDIPDIILYNSSDIRKQFLAGLIDAIGIFISVKKEHTVLYFTSKNEMFINQIVYLLRSLGYATNIKITRTYTLSMHTFIKNYHLYAYGDFSNLPIQIPYKQNKCSNSSPMQFSFSLEYVGEGEYYGFTLDSEDKLFLLANGIVVHNTESISSFVGFLLDNYPNMRIGVFTPKIQQAEITIGRLSIFFQMNEERLNNRIIKCTKQKIELSNNSYVSAVSASDQSNIEGLTFDIIILDEAQKISDYTWSERILPMSGSCNLATTRIYQADGVEDTIENIVKNKINVPIVSYDSKTRLITTSRIINWLDMGIKDTVKITLDTGKTLEVTKDHRLLTWIRDAVPRHPEWITADQIKIGTRIGVPRSLPFFGSIYEPDARLLGLLIGDGSYSQNKTIHFGSYSDALWNYIINMYNLNNIKYYRQFTTTDGKNYRAARIKELIPIVKKAGIYGQTSTHKTLPKNVLRWNKSSLQELISGLFDTDGNFYIPEHDEKYRPTISFANICESIINDMQMILIKFGISSKVQCRQEKDSKLVKATNNKYYVLHIRGKENCEAFYKNFQILEEDKRNKLQQIYDYFQKHKHKVDKSILNTDLRFEKVINIEYGNGHVYDLTVDKYHTYIANGIISHNCNGKVIQIGTPKARNHFYEAVEGKESDQWTVIRKDWTECEQLSMLSSIKLPDHTDPAHERLREYSTFVLSLMPKVLKQEYFPTRPDIWTEGSMSVEDFKTQYMLQFVDGAAQFLTADEMNLLKSGDFEWMTKGIYGDKYFAGIDFAGSTSDNSDYTHISIIRVDTQTNQKQKVFALELSGMSYPEQINIIDELLGGKNPRFYCQAIFADFTGCGRPVVQTLIEERGLHQLTGITFNAADTFMNTGMNMKNAMFTYTKQEIDYGRFKYPSLNNYIKIASKDKIGFWHKMIGEWNDLQAFQKNVNSINRSISAPRGAHDDVPCADCLAVLGSLVSNRSMRMPKPVMTRLSR